MGSADTVRLTEATTSGAASAMPGWKSRSAASTATTSCATPGARCDDGRSSCRCSRSATNRASLVVQGIERSSRSSAARSIHTSRGIDRREVPECGCSGAHRRSTTRAWCRRSRRSTSRPSSSISTPACEQARAGPESMPASTSASRTCPVRRPEPLRLVEHGVARVVEGDAVAEVTLGRAPRARGRWRRGRAACSRPGSRSTGAPRQGRARRRRARRGSRPTVGSAIRRTGRSRSRPRTCGAALRS